MDLFVVPTLSFRLLYGLLILHHDRRQILWLGVTAHPTAEWISRQLTEAYGWKVEPRYIVRDRDAVYGDVFIRRLRAMGIRDRPTAARSPWQNGYCERAIGSIRRECLDHVVVFGERHLRHLLRSYASQQGRADPANSTCRWSHCAYAISWRTPSSVCACLISDRHSGHEAARIHHVSRRCCGYVAAYCACASCADILGDVSRHTLMLVDLTKPIRSVRHQCRFGHRGKHTTCRPAKNKFPQPGMPVPAHDNKIGICIGCI
jgi:hypothetical protein